MLAIGLMSGTSMDGIDVAAIETDGEHVTWFGPSATYPYADAERALLRRALDEARTLEDRDARPGAIGDAERMVTERHAECVLKFLDANEIERARVGVVGFHGQTVLHRPQARLTIQIGDGAALARAMGIPVVYDFRAHDMAAGGQGAPLVPVFHRALALARPARPVVFVNIGGVANVTFVGANDELIAFDTGPGNAMIDDWVRHKTGHSHDEDGRIARKGKVSIDTLERLLGDPYFARRPPKSLDRNHFSLEMVRTLNAANGARTLTELTASSIALAAALLPEPPREWIIVGGGRRNAFLMQKLLGLLMTPMRIAEEIGLDGDAIEAQGFAFLAVRSLQSLPLTYPTTTGVPEAMTGGVLARP